MRWLGAVQSQDYPGGKWAVAQRTRGVVDAGLDRAFNDGRILRTHVMRPTWHFVMPEDIRWLLALTGPRVNRTTASYYRRHGIDAAMVAKARKAVEKRLAGNNHRTRAELETVYADAGIILDNLGRSFLTAHLELDAIICSGAMRGKQHTYALIEERAPAAPVPSRDEMLTELVVRYFTSHGPAGIADFCWWSGLTVADAKRGLAAAGDLLSEETVGDRPLWAAPSGKAPRPGKPPIVHLLPNYDEYLISYKHRSDYYDGDHFIVQPPTDAFYRHMVFIDGYLCGRWDRTVTKKGVAVEVTLYVESSAAIDAAIEAEVVRHGAYLGLPASLERLEPVEGERRPSRRSLRLV